MWCSRSLRWRNVAERVFPWAVVHVNKGRIRRISSYRETRIKCQTEQITEEKSRYCQGNKCKILMRALVQGKDNVEEFSVPKEFYQRFSLQGSVPSTFCKSTFLRTVNVLEMLPLFHGPLNTSKKGMDFFQVFLVSGFNMLL